MKKLSFFHTPTLLERNFLMNNDKDNATLYAELKAERFMTDQISLLHEAEDLADGINFMLKSIGEFIDADRAYVFETSENHTSTNTYE